jgi:hypothetical protein
LFNGEWGRLEDFLKTYDLNGVELFINQDPIPADVPDRLIIGTHLPYWAALHRVWEDDSVFDKGVNDLEKAFLYGGNSKAELLDNFRKSLANASSLGANYAVFHVAYSEPSYIFSHDAECSNLDVFRTTADFLNSAVSVLDNGEPPVRIFFENLWWPGLTLIDPAEVSMFTDMLNFDNWAFVLDTGHLIAAIGNCTDEGQAVDAVLNQLSSHDDDLVDRIEGMHLHCGLSGGYSRNAFEDYHDPDNDDPSSVLFEAMGLSKTLGLQSLS